MDGPDSSSVQYGRPIHTELNWTENVLISGPEVSIGSGAASSSHDSKADGEIARRNADLTQEWDPGTPRAAPNGRNEAGIPVQSVQFRMDRNSILN